MDPRQDEPDFRIDCPDRQRAGRSDGSGRSWLPFIRKDSRELFSRLTVTANLTSMPLPFAIPTYGSWLDTVGGPGSRKWSRSLGGSRIYTWTSARSGRTTSQLTGAAGTCCGTTSRGRSRTRSLFGSTWQLLGMPLSEVLAKVRSLCLPPEIEHKWLVGNAAGLFGIGHPLGLNPAHITGVRAASRDR